MRRFTAVLLCFALSWLPLHAGLGESAGASSGGYEYALNEDGTAGIARYTGSDTQLTIPDSLDGHPVTSVGAEAFMNNGLLQGVTVPEGVAAIGMKAFYNCSGLSDVVLPGSLRTIGVLAFSYCGSLQAVTVPEGTQSIGEYAFGDCTVLLHVFLPDSVMKIGTDAFVGASPDFKLWCSQDSFAQGYAAEQGIAFGDPDSYEPEELPETTAGDTQTVPVEETAAEPEQMTGKEITLSFPSGERTGNYSGETQDGLPHGKGSFSSANSEGTGWTYTGNWEMGVIRGEGETVWENGIGYRGSYERFELTHGQLFKGETVLYDGAFSTGLTGGPVFHGQGKLYNALGRLIFEGEFEKGYLKETEAGRSARAAVLDPQCQSMTNDEYLALLNTQETGLLVKLQGTVGEITVLDSEGHCEFYLLNGGSGAYPVKMEYRCGVDEPKLETGQSVTAWGSVIGIHIQEAGEAPEQAADTGTGATPKSGEASDAATAAGERLMPKVEADVVAMTADTPARGSDNVRLEALKLLDGRPLKNGEFTFLLCQTWTAIERRVDPLTGIIIYVPVTYTQQLQTKANGRDGKVAFDPIRFTAADIGRTFTFTITEVPGTEQGMAFNPMVLTVTVIVADSGGTPSAIVYYPADTAFNNTYLVSSEIQIQLNKELQGRALKNGEFSFELKQGNKVLLTSKNDKRGGISFDPIRYTRADAGKTFSYKVSEIRGNEAGMTYDQQPKTVKVTVADDGSGIMSVKAEYPGDAIFNNSYKASGEVAPVFSVALENRALKSKEFNFEIKLGEKVLQKISNDKEGKVAFNPIRFTQADIGNTYVYEVRQIPGKAAGMTYDLSVKTAKVTIRDAGNGKLGADIEYPSGNRWVNSFDPTSVPTPKPIATKKPVIQAGELNGGWSYVTTYTKYTGRGTPSEPFPQIFQGSFTLEMNNDGTGVIIWGEVSGTTTLKNSKFTAKYSWDIYKDTISAALSSKDGTMTLTGTIKQDVGPGYYSGTWTAEKIQQQ